MLIPSIRRSTVLCSGSTCSSLAPTQFTEAVGLQSGRLAAVTPLSLVQGDKQGTGTLCGSSQPRRWAGQQFPECFCLFSATMRALWVQGYVMHTLPPSTLFSHV